MTMKAYRFQIWHEVTTLGGGFSHNSERLQTVHAKNVKDAKEKITLGEREFIYTITCLGTVRTVVTTTYEYTPLKKIKYEHGVKYY
mgnify:CR=1 FL=1